MVAITFQPLLANNIAVALPKPVEAPVMKIVLVILIAYLLFDKTNSISFKRAMKAIAL